MGDVAIGMDVGQRHDPTAIVVVEAEWRPDPERPRSQVSHFIARHLQRLDLGTPYPVVARRVTELGRSLREKIGSTPELFVDATGVGTPVVDLLQADYSGNVVACYFTHGDRRTEKHSGEVTIGKAWLVSHLQALLQTGRIHLPKTAEAVALARELLDYEIRVDANANDTYGAFRVGSHDDLVTALGLAVQREPVGEIVMVRAW